MNTTENEIQALHKEIDDLRNENIALYNELTKQNKILFEQVISIGKELANQQKKHQDHLQRVIEFYGGGCSVGHDNLRMQLQRLAGMQTAEFIVKNMVAVKSLGDRINQLKYAVAQATKNGGGI